MKAFIIIFTLALLFVIGSAGMMRFFDKKQLQKKDNDKNDKPPLDK